MSLLTVVQSVCQAVGVEQPTSVFQSIQANRTMQEMVAVATDMAQRIAYETREWQQLKLRATFTGDGVVKPGTNEIIGTTVFPLPANFKRMLLNTNVYRSTSALQPMMFVPDADDWLQRRLLQYQSPWGEWTILGNAMNIWPILMGPVGTAPAQTVTFNYLDKNCITLGGPPVGGVSDRFFADYDTFRLDERLLKLGMIWQWKANKGSPYAEDMQNYADALSYVAGADTPAPIIIGRLPSSMSVRTAYPFPLPTPGGP